MFVRSLVTSVVTILALTTAAFPQAVNNGSFNDPNGAFQSGSRGQMATGWVSGDSLGGTPDWDVPPGTVTFHKQVPASPDGGLYMAMLGYDSIGGSHQTLGESIKQNVTGFTPGRNYRVTFHQINIPMTVARVVGPEVEYGPNEDGHFSVTLFNTTLDSHRMNANSNFWSPVSLEFTAPANTTDSELKIQAKDANPGNGNTANDGLAYIGIDGISITAAPRLAGLRNFDVLNRTGQYANDFHVLLKGVTPDQVGPTLWLNNYPNASISEVPGGTVISWDGGGTPANAREHFGYNLIGLATRASGVEMWWTRDGVSIGRVAAADHTWTPISDRIAISELTLDETFLSGEVYLSRRVAVIPGNVVLEDLVVDGPGWLESEQIDHEPLLLHPGEPVPYQVTASPEFEESMIMIYDLWSEPVDLNRPRHELEECLLATYHEGLPRAALDEWMQ